MRQIYSSMPRAETFERDFFYAVLCAFFLLVMLTNEGQSLCPVLPCPPVRQNAVSPSSTLIPEQMT